MKLLPFHPQGIEVFDLCPSSTDLRVFVFLLPLNWHSKVKPIKPTPPSYNHIFSALEVTFMDY